MSRIHILQQSICIVCANKRYTYKTNVYDILGCCKLKKKGKKSFNTFMTINYTKTSGFFGTRNLKGKSSQWRKIRNVLPSSDRLDVTIPRSRQLQSIYPSFCPNQQIFGRLTAELIRVPGLVVNSGRSVK